MPVLPVLLVQGLHGESAEAGVELHEPGQEHPVSFDHRDRASLLGAALWKSMILPSLTWYQLMIRLLSPNVRFLSHL